MPNSQIFDTELLIDDANRTEENQCN